MLLLVNQEALRFALLAAEWGHSFRPAYFRLGAALAGSAVCAERILALTATATRATETAIRQVCQCGGRGVTAAGWRFPYCTCPQPPCAPPPMLDPTGASGQGTRERICGLFTAGGPLSSVRSAIVYVAFKEDANQLVGEGYLSSLAL